MSEGTAWNRSQALALAASSGLSPLDLSLGVPADPPPLLADSSALPPAEPAALAEYPLSAGSAELRSAIRQHFWYRYEVALPAEAVAACAGAKEFIATLPLFLKDQRDHATPDTLRPVRRRDTVLIPALGYPPYEFGARIAGLQVHRVPTDGRFRMAVDRLPADVVSRALGLWVNSPANPTGVVEPLDKIARWGRDHGVPVLCDEAYADMTWQHDATTVLQGGLDGVLAVQSVSKRSNAPGLRVGFYAGDPHLVAGLVVRRRAAGLIANAQAQALAVRLLNDDQHAGQQRERTARRVQGLVAVLNAHGFACQHPHGGMFVWLPVPGGNGLDFARRAAESAGLVVTPGSEYGPTGGGYVRIAAVCDPDVVSSRVALLASVSAGGSLNGWGA